MLEEKDMKYDSVQKFNSVENYILQMRPILKKRALFSDGTSDYRIPAEPKAGEHVKLRFRTAADNVDLVVLCHEDERIEMQIADRESDFDYYEAAVMTGQVFPGNIVHSMNFVSFRDFRHRSGPKVR